MACSCVDCPASCPASDNSMFAPPNHHLDVTFLGADVYILSVVLAYIVILVVTAYVVFRKYRRGPRRKRGRAGQ